MQDKIETKYETNPETPAWLNALYGALSGLEDAKPDDRSERARKYAIAITDLEKLIGYCSFYLNRK